MFSPLSIAMGADSALAALLKDVALGTHIPSIRLEGVRAGADPAAVYDLTLTDVLVQQVHDSEGGGDDRLVFDYGKIGLITKAQDPTTGALTVSSSFGFNVATGTAIDPATLPAPTVGTTPPAATASKYYLLIDGVKGTSTDEDHQGWFEIAGFDLDVSNLTDTSGSGTGKAVFSPLSIAMGADSALAALLKDVALGTHIPSIRLEGVRAGADPAAVYDLTLTDVLVQQVHDSEGGGDDRLVFDYGKIGLITKAQDPTTGALTVSSSFGFNVATGTAIDPATLPAPTVGTTPPAATASKYYLLIDGVKGTSTDEDHQGWFEIAGFDLDVSNLTDTSGSGTGKAVFSPLSIAMGADSALAALLKDVALGTHIPSIRLEGVRAGADPAAVYDLTLTDVLVQQVHDSEGGGDDRLVFDYGKIGLITKAQDPTTGALTVSSSFGFNVATGTAIDPATLPAPTVGGVITAELASTTSHGSLSFNPDGSFEYVPDANFHGIDSFVYHARQADTVSNDITVQINVATVNDPPVATIIFGDSNENTGNPVMLTAVFDDPDNDDSHTFTTNTAGTLGKVVNNGDGTFSYDPNGKFESLAVGATAFDTFIFTVIDSSGVSSTATAKITIHGENDAPETSPDIAALRPASVFSRDAAHGVLANDHDPDLGDTLSVAAITFGPTTKAIPLNSNVTMKGTYGDLTIDSDGSYSYAAGKAQPSQGLAQDSFSYTAIDAHGGATRASLTIAITNDPM